MDGARWMKSLDYNLSMILTTTVRLQISRVRQK